MANGGQINVWYKLIDAKTAIISHEKPLGEDWTSLKRVTEARFLLYEAEMGKRLYNCTSKLSSDHVLTPLMLTKDEKKKAFIIFYPKFKEFCEWWDMKIIKAHGSDKDELLCWLVKNARKLLKSIIQAHAKGIAHRGLRDWSNYVYVGTGNDVKPMLMNFSTCINDLNDGENWRAKCLEDVSDFIKQIGELIPDFRSEDFTQMKQWLAQLKLKTHGSSERILTFPYWKRAYKRLQVFFDVDKALNLNGTLTMVITKDLDAKARFKLPWDRKLKFAPLLQDHNVEKGLKEIYRERVYDGKKYNDLIKFLRHVYVHATNKGIYKDYDDYVCKNYPGLISIIHDRCL